MRIKKLRFKLGNYGVDVMIICSDTLLLMMDHSFTSAPENVTTVSLR